MFATAIRMYANRYPYIKAPLFSSPAQAEEAQRLSAVILSILRSHGPLSVDHCWAHVKATGFRSKRHMKLVLKWMRERQQAKVVCQHLSDLAGLHGDKEFFYAAFDYKRATSTNVDSGASVDFTED